MGRETVCLVYAEMQVNWNMHECDAVLKRWSEMDEESEAVVYRHPLCVWDGLKVEWMWAMREMPWWMMENDGLEMQLVVGVVEVY